MRRLISNGNEQMLFYLRSQVAFAVINAIPGAFITFVAASTIFIAARSLLTTGFFWDAAIPAVGWFGYVALAIYNFIQWMAIDRHRAFSRLRRLPGILSILLWAIPLLSFVAVCVLCYLAATDDKPDLFNDVELNMYTFLIYAAIATVWFAIPALFAALAYSRARSA
jgi:hypothetical protein